MPERGTAPTERGVSTTNGTGPGEPSDVGPAPNLGAGLLDPSDWALAELTSSYELLAELGRGGSAVVYRARDRHLLREVALKIVRLAPALNERERTAEVARLAREARTVARLQHANIVAVHAVHELRDGLAVSMQYVPGRTLKQAVADDGAFAPDRAVAVLRDVAAALAHAHAHGVIHRDVKPENIFLDGVTGRALLADFGAARAGDVDVRVTRTGATVGTPAYMSPEQIDGGPVDARADLYSLGLVAWEALTGHRPWEQAGLYQVLHHQKYDVLPPIACVRPAAAPPVPLVLEYVIARLLEKRPRARWASAEAVVAQLERPVLPGDFKLWERTHRRRAAEFARSGGAGGTGTSAISMAAPTEQLRPGQRALAYASASAAMSPPGTPADDDLPSWAHGPPPRRRWWYVGGTAAALLVVLLPFLTLRQASRQAPPQASRQRTPTARRTQAEPRLVARSSTPPADGLSPSSVATGEVAGPFGVVAEPMATPVTAGGERPAGDGPSAGDTLRRIVVPTPAQTAQTRPPARPPVAVPPVAVPPVSTPAQRTTAAPPTLPVVLPPAPAPAAPPAAFPAPVRAVLTGERSVVAAGARHTCALDAAGRARCWGANDAGQLGTGDLSAYDAPASVTGEIRFAQLATGGAHSCGLTAAGDVYCWGDDDHGQLGDAATGAQSTPSRVAGAWSYRLVRAGLDHTCGLSTANTVVCWGSNARGQLGDGTTRDRPTPVLVAGLRASVITVGWRHSCALTADGVALCWGENADGQLGDGSQAARATPVAVAGGRRYVAIAAGAAHTCAVTSVGETYCWGTGGVDRTAHPTPVRVDAPAAFTALAAGSVHSCGRTVAGAVYCWGRNPYGQLGDGTTVDRWRPVRVPGGPFASLSASGAHTCALDNGAPACWGYNVNGQLGDGTRTHHASPRRVAPASP